MKKASMFVGNQVSEKVTCNKKKKGEEKCKRKMRRKIPKNATASTDGFDAGAKNDQGSDRNEELPVNRMLAVLEKIPGIDIDPSETNQESRDLKMQVWFAVLDFFHKRFRQAAPRALLLVNPDPGIARFYREYEYLSANRGEIDFATVLSFSAQNREEAEGFHQYWEEYHRIPYTWQIQGRSKAPAA